MLKGDRAKVIKKEEEAGPIQIRVGRPRKSNDRDDVEIVQGEDAEKAACIKALEVMTG